MRSAGGNLGAKNLLEPGLNLLEDSPISYCWQLLGSNLQVCLLLRPSLITIFNNENTQSPRMRAMIPLAKSLTCINTSLPLKSEASLPVYSHHAYSIVVLVDMGMITTYEKNTRQFARITSTYLSYMGSAHVVTALKSQYTISI